MCLCSLTARAGSRGGAQPVPRVSRGRGQHGSTAATRLCVFQTRLLRRAPAAGPAPDPAPAPAVGSRPRPLGSCPRRAPGSPFTAALPQHSRVPSGQPRSPLHGPAPSGQPRSLRTAALPPHGSASSGQPRSFRTAALPTHGSASSGQPRSLRTAPFPPHSPAPSGQPRSLGTAALPQDSRAPSGQPRSLRTAALLQDSPAPSGQPRSLRTAPLPQDSPAPSGQPRSLRTAPLPQDSPAPSGQPRSLRTAPLPRDSPAPAPLRTRGGFRSRAVTVRPPRSPHTPRPYPRRSEPRCCPADTASLPGPAPPRPAGRGGGTRPGRPHGAAVHPGAAGQAQGPANPAERKAELINTSKKKPSCPSTLGRTGGTKGCGPDRRW
ncbi:translation initiation factor IF-2-like [Malurus melanocephalus]|uniref:translation initiation factor IF-2-like n=1 Tax=Malurus melanocephalus TaxID=175006 RepID=UPI002547658D|nr:translation initiation factor IF-2-like [Malurus melanocephalus]